jgi:hypothetical protein
MPSQTTTCESGQEEQRRGHQVGDEDRRAEGVDAREAEARQAVAREDRDHERDRRGRDADDEAVLHPGEELGLGEEEPVVVGDDAGLDEERDRLEVVELGVALERRDHHEVEGEEREEDEGHDVRVPEDRAPGALAAGAHAHLHAHSLRM